MQDGDVCLALGRVYRGGMLLYPALKYVKCWRGAGWVGMLSIRECIQGRYVIIPRTQICKVLEGVQDGEVCLSLGSYVIIPRTQICIVLEGMQDGEVCLAPGSAQWGSMLSYPARKYVKCWRGCKMGRYA